MLTFWIACAAGLTVGYLLGSIPTGYLAGKLLRGVDIRAEGSGSTGATNVLRTLGKWPALAVLIIGALKGAAAVLFGRWFYPWLADAVALPAGPAAAAAAAAWTPWAICLTGLAALVGHARPVWLNFAGGKSVAAGLGLLLALAWPAGVGGLAVFALTAAIFRIVSLGSILAAATAVALVWILNEPLAYRLLVTAGGLYVIARHRANIGRLLAGAEPRLGQSLGPQG